MSQITSSQEMQEAVTALGIAFEVTRRGRWLVTIKRACELTQAERDALAGLGWEISQAPGGGPGLSGCTWQQPPEDVTPHAATPESTKWFEELS